MERGRTTSLRLLGTGHRALFEEADEAPRFAFVGAIDAHRFPKPARMDDVLDIITDPRQVKGPRSRCISRSCAPMSYLVDAQLRSLRASPAAGRSQIPKALRLAMLANEAGPAERL